MTNTTFLCGSPQIENRNIPDEPAEEDKMQNHAENRESINKEDKSGDQHSEKEDSGAANNCKLNTCPTKETIAEDDSAASKREKFKKKVFRSGYQKRYEVKNVDAEGNRSSKVSCNESAIDFKIVVEEFRFYWYLLFCVMTLLGYILTVNFAESYFGCDKYPALLTSVFGSLNMCVYYDFPPVTYVLPSLYSIVVVLAYLYVIAAIFRAWISKEENRISNLAFKIYSGVLVYFALSISFFSTIFAVPPNLGEGSETVQIHTLPYSNLCVALCSLQICVTWFGVNVAWTELNAPKLFKLCSIGCVGLLTFTAISKIILHINALGDVGECNPGKNWKELICQSPNANDICGKGLIWRVHSEEAIIFSRLVEWTFRLSALVAPLFQTGYLYFRHFRTHHIIFSVRDNKEVIKD